MKYVMKLDANPETSPAPNPIKILTNKSLFICHLSFSEAQERLILLNEGMWQADNGRLTYFEDGQVVSNQWFRDQNGQKRFATDIVADEAFFVDAKSESPLAVQQAAAGYQAAAQAPSYVPDGYAANTASAGAGSYQNTSAPKFEDLSDDWKCPRCKQPKEKFNKAQCTA